MTFVPGVDLAQQLARRARPFALNTVLAWADDLLDVLMYLHTRQPPVIHRDIKPRNLKLDAHGHIVLLDFGLAKEAIGAPDVSLAGFTLPYAPLEQVRRQGTEARSDLYALAATLYELLSRRAPADAVERAAVLAEGGAEPLIPLHELNPRVPQAVASVIAQALAPRPSQRPATARAMQAALREAAEGPVTVLSAPAGPGADHASVEPPTGTVTFLATELTASGVAHADLARHDGTQRQAVDAHGGYVFRSGTAGLSAAFTTAGAALAVALEVQRTLPSLRVRMALVTGAAELVDGEYVSHALPRLARVLEAAHGGQVLLGRATVGLLGPYPVRSLTLRNLGSHRLAELAEPEHLYQVVVADLPADFPPLISREVRMAGLPLSGPSPIGREHEVADLVAHLRRPSVRLLTLTGPGGVGKTCLALFAAETLLDDVSGGVYVVPLAAVRSPELVIGAIAQALGIPEGPGLQVFETVAADLAQREVLLVLDNFEQVLPAAALVRALLDAAPRVKVLVTSRMALGVAGEHAQQVAPLAFADPRQLLTPAELGRFPAVELFVERARAVQPDVVLNDQTASAIAGICARLDGLPLAIELAAARSDLFTPAALLARLDRRLRLLTVGASERPACQQTLRAALAWSYDLLPASEQRLFGRLGAFDGGWDLEAAEAVCAAADDTGAGVADGLAALAATNLIGSGRGTRFEMLETVREYAAERLDRDPECTSVKERHAAYFVELAETADAELAGPRMGAWLARLAIEHPNLRAALDWLAARDAGLRLAGALWRFWQVHGHVAEGRRWLERLLELQANGALSQARARALVGAGALAWRQQDGPAARRWLSAAVDACRAVDDRAGLATAQKYLGVVALKGPPPDFDAAARLFEASLDLRRQLGDRDGTASCLNDLAVMALDQGDYKRAGRLLDESLALCRALDNRYGLSFVLNNLSLVALAEEAYERVPPLLRESLVLARELGSREKIGCVLTTLASLASATAEARTAARLFGAAEALRETIGVPMSTAEQATHDRHLARARARLEPAAWDGAVAEGRAAELDEVIEQTLEHLAGV
jgi:predicted ATPase